MAHSAPPRTTRRRTDVLVAAVLASTVTAGALLQLFFGPDVGLADNGDGFRLMCSFELVKHKDVLFNPLEVRYDSAYGCDSRLTYFSSQQWLTGIAVQAFALVFGADAGFDLRTAGVVHAVVLGAALGLLHLVLPGSRLRRVVTVVLAGVLLLDITFVSYFVSPFSEPATFLGVLLVTAAVLWYVRTGRGAPLALVLLVAAGVFLALAKSQTVVFAALLVPVLLLRTVELGRLRGWWWGRLLPAAAALVLVAVPLVSLVQRPPFYERVNLHNLVFFGLLFESDDPAATLRELGGDESLTQYTGVGYFAPGMEEREADPAYQRFLAEASRVEVVRHVATDPQYWSPFAREGAKAAAIVRVHYLSNYLEPRPEGELLAPRPDPTRRALLGLGPWAWPLLPVLWLGVAAGSVVLALRRSSPPARRATAAALYLLSTGAAATVAVAVVGDGYYELVKHTVLAGWCTALMAALGAGWALDAAVSAARRRAKLPSAEDRHPTEAASTTGSST